MVKKKQDIYLIDGSSYIYRAYHAMGGLSNSKGFPTAAVFGFTNMIMKTLKDKAPSRIVVVFDAKGPTFRHKAYSEYKANRPPMPEDLRVQIPWIHKIVEAYKLPSLAIEGYEADDIIATITSRAHDAGWDVVIVSGDKDLTQLVQDGVRMWDPQKDTLYDPETVEKKFGVRPELILDFLALTGDSSDNIPGVTGVGPKTAARLLAERGSLDGVYSAVDEISQKKLKENLVKDKDKAFLSRDLARLCSEAPVGRELDEFAIGEQDSGALKEIFQELEFRALLADLPAEKNLDFGRYRTIRTVEDLKKWLAGLNPSAPLSVDCETTSEQPVRARLVGVSLCSEPGDALYIPVGHTKGEQADKREILETLRPALEDEGIEKIGQNIKYDLIVFKREGVEINGIGCDTMLASYLLDPGRRGHSLDVLAELFLSHRAIPIKELIGTGKSQILFSEVDIDKASDYACEDADVALRVAQVLMPKVKDEGLENLFRTVELPLIPVLADMEIAGVRVDTTYLWQLSLEFGQTLEKVEAEIYKLAGECFNINSPKQLSEILFNRIGLKPKKKTKTGMSTSLDVLEELALEHDLPKKILEYRSVFKLKSTYVDSLSSLVNPETGRIHTSYNQAVAATGRLSSSDPNLQNIPVRSAEGRKIRKAFIPAEGSAFVAADYSQIELRVMAHISGDPRLSQAFSAGEDIHAITASEVFGVSPAHVTPDMRRKAKEINFGIIYGMGPFKLAGQLGVGMGMARQYLEQYYQTYAGVHAFMEELPERATRDGFVTTILGRKRFLPDLNNPNRIAQQAARRMAINTTIQGSAADLMKLAMIKVHRAIKESGLPAAMILQVHDEIILEVRDEAARDAEKLLKKEMEGVYKLSAPLVVDTATGKNWDEAH